MKTREQAMQWFNEKDTYNKSELSHKYYKDSVSYNFTALTGREIEEIWQKETKTVNIKTYINKDDHSIKVCLNTNLDINEIDKKINQIESNIYLNRLKEQYKKVKEYTEKDYMYYAEMHKKDYQAMRLFCLDTQLVSFNDIEAMEFEVNQSF